MDRAEQIVADKRIARWPEDERKWLARLTEAEQEVVRVFVAHLDARPQEGDKPV